MYGHAGRSRNSLPVRITRQTEPAESFRGVGPKGYRRSDNRIREDICDFLTDHPQIDASDIEVEVNEGDVVLKGLAESRKMKRLAEELSEMVPGVRDVNNLIHIKSRLESASRSKMGNKLKERKAA